jgi:hypothetical protein
MAIEWAAQHGLERRIDGMIKQIGRKRTEKERKRQMGGTQRRNAGVTFLAPKPTLP